MKNLGIVCRRGAAERKGKMALFEAAKVSLQNYFKWDSRNLMEVHPLRHLMDPDD